jgi:hypothetical protein
VNVQRSDNPSTLTGILELESRLDGLLGRPRVSDAQLGALRQAALSWSTAVWSAAQSAGSLKLDAAEVSRGLDLASRPVFMCGAHRSGTTLVQSLLDSHPGLAVLPSEGMYFASFEARLGRLPPDERLTSFCCDWVRKLANPIHQSPYWLLGRTSDEYSPYVDFARALMAWWPVTEKHLGAVSSSWPLAATALAYAHVSGGVSVHLRRWAEKTPTNERNLDRLWHEFPDAKIIHVVRNPISVFASHKASTACTSVWLRTARRVLRDLNLSYQIAAERSRSASDRYLLVRYEEVLTDAAGIAGRLAAFLDIEPLAILVQPTVAGQPSISNSSFTAEAAPGRIQAPVDVRTELLTRFELETLAAVLGETASALGYKLAPVPPWRRRLLRLTANRLGRPLETLFSVW